MPTLSRRSLSGLLAAAAILPAARARAADAPAPLDLVAEFGDQVTGVAVAPSGRIFVNFPRWEQDVAISVAEVMKDGSLKPFPNAEWNSWRNTNKLSTGDHFVCVQSVTVDPQGFLWVVDPAAPGNEFNLDGGPKLVKIDLNGDKVVKVIHFDRTAVPQGSYINDVRISPDGRTAYLTDSGVKGALLVVDISSGKTRRVLEGDKSTQVDQSVKVTSGGKELKRPDGRDPAFSADGIALDPKGEYLYWQVLHGDTLYRVATKALQSGTKPAVENLGKVVVADGYWMDKKGRLFITSPSDNSVKLWAGKGDLRIVAQDDRLVWPDSMAEGPDGLYVTASHIPEMTMFTGKPHEFKTQLFRFRPPA